MFTPLLADDFGTLISAIVVIMGFIGWIFNLISGKNQAQQPTPRPRPRREAREDVFLEDEPVRRPSKGRKPKAQAPDRPVETKKPNRRPVTEMVDRHLRTSDLGVGVRTHVSEIQAQKIDAAVQKDMQPRVEQAVAEHLGAFSAAASPTATAQANSLAASKAAQQIVQTLRDPLTVRQAIIINSILSPPPGRRKT